MNPSWRPDIDGLRALAILPVLFYHYDVPGFAGGFVGVDVFFVISGYLITGILVREIRAGAFSVLRFYERRARRILPALITVVVVTFVVGLLVLPPVALIELGNEAIWSSFFSANFWFFKKVSYFGGASTLKPLLHLWSLAIEEQFYVVFPLLLILLRRSGLRDRGSAAWLTAIFVSSLGFSIAAARWWPTAGFFLLPSRAWELMLGALLVVVPRSSLPNWGRQLAAAGGLAAIVAAATLYSDKAPFPGAAALLPCLGAAALIVAGEGAAPPMGSRLLALPQAVWFGRISYALYLWHWPLLALARHYYLGEPLAEPPAAARLALAGLAIALAVVTTSLIEAPVRGRRLLPGRSRMLIASAASLAVLVAMGEAAGFAEGFPARLASYDAAAPNNRNLCNDQSRLTRFSAGWKCRVGLPASDGRQPDFIVWGDSHSAQFSSVLDAIAVSRHLTGQILWTGGCPPLVGVDVMSGRGGSSPGECFAFDRDVARALRDTRGETVLLAAYWTNLYSVGYFPRNVGDALDEGLGRTLTLLHEVGARAVLVQDQPRQPVSIVDARTESRLLHRPLSRPIEVPRQIAEAQQAWIDQRFRRAEAEGSAAYLRTFDVLCGLEQCLAEREGEELYIDDNHLSPAGTMRLRGLLEQMLADPEKTAPLSPAAQPSPPPRALQAGEN